MRCTAKLVKDLRTLAWLSATKSEPGDSYQTYFVGY